MRGYVKAVSYTHLDVYKRQEDYNALLEAVQNGTVTEERLNEAVLRILAMKYCTQYQWERVVG